MRRIPGKAWACCGAALVLVLAGVGTAHAATVAARPASTGGVCPSGGSFPSPLPSATLTATKIKGGFNFLEGPVWDAASGTLLFSDMGNSTGIEKVQPSTIRRFTPPGTFTTFIANSGSNGLAITPDGATILAATQDQRNVSSYRLSTRARGVVASTFQGRTFNSPNDLTVRSDGTVYFTDPNFQRGNRADQFGGKTGVFRVTGGGTVTLVDDGVSEPNGIALSPDEHTLYVAGNAANKIFKYPVRADGSTGPRTDFATVAGPDGVTVDCAGNVYWASFNDGKVHVFTPAGHEFGTISAGRNTTNLAFGGADRKTLFITSGATGDFGLYSVRLNVPGNPF